MAICLSLCCHTLPMGHTVTHKPVEPGGGGGLNKCWWLMPHVCTQGAGRGPPALKLPLATNTSPSPSAVSSAPERISSWEYLLDR